jgi:site-specific recombinase XerD
MVEDVCRWIISLSSAGKTLSTIIAYTDAIIDFLRTLHACRDSWNVLNWQTVSERVLASYYQSTKEKTSLATANIYLTRIMLFYKWARARNIIFCLPWEVISINGSNAEENPGYYTTGNIVFSDSIRQSSPIKDVEVYSPDEEKKIREHLNSRDQLISKWAKLVGARRFELAAMDLKTFQNINMEGERMALLPITKSGTPEKVYVPKRLWAITEQYINFERAMYIEGARKRATKRGEAYTEPEALFLNKSGNRISRGRISKNWYTAVKKSEVRRGTFHWNRHGFATDLMHDLTAMKRDDINLNIEKTLQSAVRHKNVTTTKRFYIAKSERDRAAVKRAMDRRAEQSDWD